MGACGLALGLFAIACGDGNITSGNTPPSATILEPGDNAQRSATSPLELLGVAGDTGTSAADLRVTWTSSIGGVLFDGRPDDDAGNTRFVWEAPAIGSHEISLSVLDPGGLSASRTVRVEVIGNTDPTCAITSPMDGATLNAGTDVLLQGQLNDTESALDTLTAAWSSDLQGPLGTASAGSQGVVSSTVALSLGTHVLTLEAEDPLGGRCETTAAVTMNGPPSTPDLAFDPVAPTTLDDLRIVLVTPSVDPEGGDITYTYAWTKNQSASPILGDLVLSGELDKGDAWEVTVVATDPDGFSSEPITAMVLVTNSPPTMPQVSITPTTPTQAQDLACVVDVPSVDADGELLIYDTTWELDGAATGLTGDVLAWQETEIGEFWTCLVSGDDGEDLGPAGIATAQIVAGCSSLQGAPPGSSNAVVPHDAALDLSAGDYTIEAWVRHQGSTGQMIVAIKGYTGAWELSLSDPPTGGSAVPGFSVLAGTTPSSVLGTQSVPANDWNHLAVTYDSGSGLGTLWLNGASIGSASLPSPPSTPQPLLIGGINGPTYWSWNGQIDDLRISSVVRYSAPFVPSSQLAADASTIALWGFEEGSGTTTGDLSLNGHDGTLAGFATFNNSQSTCTNDQAPTAPVVAVTPQFPLLNEDLTCALVSGAVDPEGAAVTYSGQWLLDGAPSGQSFTTFPGVLPSSLTAEADSWTCSVTASDASQSGPAGEDSVFTGAMPITELVVSNPSAPSTASTAFTPPVAGMVRASMSNPDGSRDGVFTIDVLGYGTTWVFTGYRDWAYAGTTVSGWAFSDVEFNLDPSLGTLTLQTAYDPAAGIDNSGPDTLSLLFVYDSELSTAGAALMLSSSVGPTDTTTSQTLQAVAVGERLLFEALSCGFGGGAHSLYADGDSVTGNDGYARVDTGFTGNCAIPLQSRSMSPGTWNFTLVNEDDFFADNTDTRAVNVYRYTP